MTWTYSFVDPQGTAVAARNQADAMIRTVEAQMLAHQEAGQHEQALQLAPQLEGYKAQRATYDERVRHYTQQSRLLGCVLLVIVFVVLGGSIVAAYSV